MAKDFKNRISSKRLNSLIPEGGSQASSTPIPTQTREIKKVSVQHQESSSPTPPATVVSTFRINTEKLKTIKAIAYWDRKKIQEVFDEALAMYIDSQAKGTVNKALEEYTKRTQ